MYSSRQLRCRGVDKADARPVVVGIDPRDIRVQVGILACVQAALAAAQGEHRGGDNPQRPTADHGFSSLGIRHLDICPADTRRHIGHLIVIRSVQGIGAPDGQNLRIFDNITLDIPGCPVNLKAAALCHGVIAEGKELSNLPDGVIVYRIFCRGVIPHKGRGD